MFGGFLWPGHLVGDQTALPKLLYQPPCGLDGSLVDGLLNHTPYLFLLCLPLERHVEPVHDFGVHGPFMVLGRSLKATSEALGKPKLQLHGIGHLAGHVSPP